MADPEALAHAVRPERVSATEFAVDRPEHLADVWRLREERYRPRFTGAAPWWLDAERDHAGHVFTGHCDGVLVSTVRILNIATGLSELAEFGQLPEQFVGRSDIWEIGRLAANHGPAGSSTGKSAVMFSWASRWADRNLHVDALISHSRRAKIAGFLAAGATIIDGPYEVADRGDDYYTVHARIADVLERIGGLSAPV